MFFRDTTLKARRSDGDEDRRRIHVEIEIGDDNRSLSASFTGAEAEYIADVLLELEDGVLKLRYWGHGDCECDPTTVVLLDEAEVDAAIGGNDA